ncbi:C40 family peptidase [Lentibacillus sp. N15]|uniref:C40 family peptidase n=1 Tax=Lentibacillus songyuanensis TaxID=3136161 RepID=UPI0031BAF056
MIEQTFEQSLDECWVTAVQVATVWTNPESAREIDKAGISNPTDIDQWVAGQTFTNRAALCDENRVQTQLLYGERVIVLAVKADWAHVIIPTQPSHKEERGYPGWVPFRQLERVSKQDWETERTITVTDKFAWLEDKSGKRVIKVSYQTHLPLRREATDRVEVVTSHGQLFIKKAAICIFETTKGLAKQSGERLIQEGKRFLGLDYFWGGMSAFGYDCSGFCYVMHKANGYRIPRDAGDQAANGQRIRLDHVLPGDLLFFAYDNGKGKLHHVGMYYGDGHMLHSPKTGRQIEILKLKGTVYEQELCIATRYWQGANDDGQ